MSLIPCGIAIFAQCPTAIVQKKKDPYYFLNFSDPEILVV